MKLPLTHISVEIELLDTLNLATRTHMKNDGGYTCKYLGMNDDGTHSYAISIRMLTTDLPSAISLMTDTLEDKFIKVYEPSSNRRVTYVEIMSSVQYRPSIFDSDKS